MIAPPHWSRDEFEMDRQRSIEIFRQQRVEEPLEEYLEQLDIALGLTEEVLEATVDLAEVQEQALWILTDPERLYTFRYLAGPPISEDDLKTLVDSNSIAPSRLREDPDLVTDVAQLVLDSLDRRRFPWVTEGREPAEAEKHAATLATAALIAMRRVSTKRRMGGKTAQEEQVMQALSAAGLQKVRARTIETLTDAPEPGAFCDESMFGDRKADVVLRLWDTRGMPIECKVSNSALNSIKRLNNDAAVKAVEWIRAFGQRQVVPTAVLSGVYDLSNLVAAQDAGLAIFWAHRLGALLEWVEETRREA